MPLTYNDQTRMSRMQLAERIRQMEATAARNSQLGAPNERHRPMEDNRRREKIALYKQELERRELADSLAAAEQQRVADQAAKQSARDLNRNLREMQIVAQAIRPEPTPDTPAKEPMLSKRDFETYTPPDDHTQYMRGEHERQRRQIAADAKEFPITGPGPQIPAPPDARLSTPCPKCHAEIGDGCTNYKGQNCAPHAGRKATICFADGCIARAVTLTPKPLCAAHALGTAQQPAASEKLAEFPQAQASTEAAPIGDTPTLDAQVEQLVRAHTLGAVLDAAWAASHRLHPWPSRHGKEAMP